MNESGLLRKIAWRNIWRNPRRSAILIGVIALGTFAFLGAMSFMDGFVKSMLESSTDFEGGHIQLLKPGYHENPTMQSYLADDTSIEAVLNKLQGITYSKEVTLSGMVSSAEKSGGVMIHGIEPLREAKVTKIVEGITEGTYAFPDSNSVLIGEALAKQLNLRLGEKLVVMLNDLDNEISSAAFRVSGLYRSVNKNFDKANIYIPIEKARSLVGYNKQAVSSFAIRLDKATEQAPIEETLKQQFDAKEVQVFPWQERLPLVVMAQEAYDYTSVFLVVLLFSAIAFTIINSFLMVIFERIREIGIMMANGVKPSQIRKMLYWEALYMVFMGLAIGVLVATLFMGYYYVHGIDLSSFSDSMSTIGIAETVYPVVNWTHVFTGFIVIFIMVLLAVLYPAFKASRFEAVDAINYV